MMGLIADLPPDQLLACYLKVKKILRGFDNIIFDAMQAAYSRAGIQFQLPNDVSEYLSKHTEIEKRLSSRSLLRGAEVGLYFFEEIADRVNNGSTPGVTCDDLLDSIRISISEGCNVFLSPKLVWSLFWEKENIVLGVHERNVGEVVPFYIVEYVKSAIASFRLGLNWAAAALISIVVEATLRDLLNPLGYSYTPSSATLDQYKTIQASVSSDGYQYFVNILEPVPNSVNDFFLATSGNTVQVEFRRNLKKTKTRVREDILIIDPADLLDYWSSDEIVAPAAKRTIEGLGGALDIARNEEKILTASDLPTDFDEVITAVRNNLIHLSGNILSTTLANFPAPHNTLIGFLSDRQMVSGLIEFVSQFVNEQYLKLRNL